MKILAVDDERPALYLLTQAIEAAAPQAEVRGFTAVEPLLAAVGEGFQPDVVFSDIEMPDMDGLELARMLKLLCPQVNLVFVTAYSQYAMDALALRPSGYVMKPVTPDKISEELNNLRCPPPRLTPDKPVRIQCFGNFEIFVNERPLSFNRAKSKEMLAYLVDRRGACCSSAETAAILWEEEPFDRSHQKQLQTIRSDLMKSLREAGAERIVRKISGGMAVDPGQFDCDYYQALAGDMVAVNSFMGEYMNNYSWAEYTTAALSMNTGKL